MILTTKHLRFIYNDGKGVFTKNTSIIPNTTQKYSCELYDIDVDGYLDLILGTRIVWGNGRTFADNDATEFVVFDNKDEGILDYDFYDLDGDGKEELLISTNGESNDRCIRVFKRNDRVFSEVTRNYFNGDESIVRETRYAAWIKMEEVDGSLFLIGRMMDNGERLFQLIDNVFVPVDNRPDPMKGIVIYYDGLDHSNPHFDLSCKDSPFAGNTCIRISNVLEWEGCSLWSNDDWIDFSDIVENDYYLEFAIKNSDPELVVAFNFETLLQTDPWYFPTYFCFYKAEEHKANGEWEVIRIPIKNCLLDEEWLGGYYWNTIKNIYVSLDSCHSQDFFLDEIRIRKVLPE